MVLVPREIVANYAQSTMIPRHRRICEAVLAATPNPVRAEQPEGKGEWKLAILSKLREALGTDGTVYRAVEAMLAAAPAAPAVGVDERRPMTPYMAKLWLDEQLADRDETLSAEVYDAIVDALAGKAGAE